MNIVHIDNYYQEGFSYQENLLSYYEMVLGNNVSVITSDRYFPFDNYETTYYSILGSRITGVRQSADRGVPIYRLPTAFEIMSNRALLLNKSSLYNLLDRLNPEVIFVHSHNNLNIFNIINWVKKNKKEVNVVLDCHSDFNNTNISKSLKGNLAYNPITRLIFNRLVTKHVYKILPITKASYEYLKYNLGISDEKLMYLYLGADDKVFYFDMKQRTLLRKQYLIPENEVIYIYTGKINEGKKVGLVVNSFINLNKKYNNVKLLMIGMVTSEYKNYVNGLNSNIIIEDYKSNNELYKYYSMADIAVWPDASNGIQESMSCRLPILINNISSITHLVDYDNGFIFNSKEECSSYMEWCILNIDKAREMGQRSEKYIKEKLSWEKIAEKSLSIYKKLI